MNKTATSGHRRLFIIEKLPEPLTPASSHLQIFDNYIENTRLRLRLVRDPYSNAWTRMLQQRVFPSETDRSVSNLAEIHLNDAEYSLFEKFRGSEIRKNRYFHEFDHQLFSFDSYLGNLRGLNTAHVDFDDVGALANFEAPPFAVFEVTGDAFFDGGNLVSKTFADIQAEIAKVGATVPTPSELQDE